MPGKRTSWSRLWVSYRREDLTEGLRARIADPAWLLARQWQFGEFQGDDAASPVRVEITHRSAEVRALKLGDATGWTRLRDGDLIEPLIEAQNKETSPSRTKLAGELGLHFLRMVPAAHRARIRLWLVSRKMHLQVGAHAPPYLRGLAHGSVDGLRLVQVKAAFCARADAENKLASGTFAGWIARLQEIAPQRFVRPIGKSWDAAQMGYRASVRAGGIALTAAAHDGGSLDWMSFDLDAAAAPDAKAPTMGSRKISTIIPTPVRYAGMPAARYWNFEAGDTYFGDLSADLTDLGQLILTEFAMVYSNDWFICPLPAKRGTLSRVTKVRILDTFGDEIVKKATSAEAEGKTPWRFFELTGDPAPGEGQSPWMYLPRAVAGQEHGRDLEQVILSRDEEANLAWGIEDVIEGSDGRPHRRVLDWQAWRADNEDPHVLADEAWKFRLSRLLPGHWIPFAPEVGEDRRPTGRLLRSRLADWDLFGADKRQLAGPQGALLEPSDALAIQEATVPRGGIVVSRQMQMARGPDGRRWLWAANRRRPASRSPSPGHPTDTIVKGKE